MPNPTDITTKQETVTETAARLRVALREQFPSVKFSVRSESFAGGTAVNVGWTDGPPRRAVERLTQGFTSHAPDQTGDFYDPKDPTLYVDRDGKLEHIRSGAKYVSEHRDLSAAAVAAAGAEIAAAAGDDQPFDARRMYRVRIRVTEAGRSAEACADEFELESGGLLACQLLAHRDLRAA